ncbi:MAG: inositol monophosphatase, partial [Deltaproteobacteria bacterium]|nr:inositol monophosphatase [Deltaproteobacteria bacterium]
GLRRPGSAAIDLCYVAAGRLDGFWEEGLKPWDTAAGMVIAEEAGGKVSTFDGRPYSPYEKTIVAANPLIHGEMVKVLNGKR